MLAVFSEQSCFRFPWNSLCNHLFAFAPESLQIVGMQDFGQMVWRKNIFQGKTGVFEIAPVRIAESPVRFQYEDVLWNGVHDLPKFHFFLPEPFLGPFSVLDVDARPIPLNNLSLFVALSDDVVQHPAILSIRPPHTRFMQEGLATGDRRAPLAHDSFDVFRMNYSCPFPALQIL